MPGPSAIASELWGAVLVGGASSRMGRSKARLEHGGRSFTAIVAAALWPHVFGVVAVGAGELPADAGPLPRLDDVPGIAGPLGGVLAALRHRPRCAWIVAACDLPLLDDAAVGWLRSQRAPDRAAILPRLAASGVEPLCGLYEPAALALLEALAARGERALQGLARESTVATPSPPEALARAWRNVNTPEDLRELEEGNPSP